ncbi:hypothetical protein GCM10027051_27680 [Niabella terrae]
MIYRIIIFIIVLQPFPKDLYPQLAIDTNTVKKILNTGDKALVEKTLDRIENLVSTGDASIDDQWPEILYSCYLLSSKIGEESDSWYFLQDAVSHGFDDSIQYITDKNRYALTTIDDDNEKLFLRIMKSNGENKKLIRSYINAFENPKGIPFDIGYKLSAKELYLKFSNWNNYPRIRRGIDDVLFELTDDNYGKIPFRVQIPQSYSRLDKSPCIILLHGATKSSTFKKANELNLNQDFSAEALARGYIVVRPIADEKRYFSWQPNPYREFPESSNLSYILLLKILSFTKKYLNIDDNRVFITGHSDGADGAYCSSLYFPNFFAGVGVFNSMFTQLGAKDLFFENYLSNSYYIVHSTEDNLRRVSHTRQVVNALRNTSVNYVYKEYEGFKHYDKHISLEQGNLYNFFDSLSRIPYPDTVCFSFNNGIFNRVAWLESTTGNTFNLASDFKFSNSGSALLGLMNLGPKDEVKSKVIATYKDNVFRVFCRNIGSIKIFLSPVMVKFDKPVTVFINGKETYHKKVEEDRYFMAKNFREKFDRSRVYATFIILNSHD